MKDSSPIAAPLVSIGVPVYNSVAELPVLLESLVSQSHHSLEIIISDNASDDGTRELCEAWCKRDSRVRYERNSHNVGAIENFNRAASFASDDFFMWAAADDFFEEDYIKACLDVLLEDKDTVLVGTQTAQFHGDATTRIFTDPGVNLIDDSVVERFKTYRMELSNRFHLGMIFYGIHRRSILEKCLPLKSILGADHVHIVSLLLEGKIKTLGETLAWKRAGGVSRSYERILRAMGIRSRIQFRIPFLYREVEIQRQIYQRLTGTLNRAALSVWSFYHFIIFDFIFRSRVGQRMSLLKKIGLKGAIRLALYYTYNQRKPFSRGYYDHKNKFLENSLNDTALIARFIDKDALPDRYGYRLDERVVEYPWVISKLKTGDDLILDAGSALNFPFIFDSMTMRDRTFAVCTLAPELVHYKSPRVSYIYDDLRSLMLKDDHFDVVTCISTIEHIGLDNTMLYSGDAQHQENKLDDYLKVIRELNRVLKPGAKLLLTVPYGKYQKFSWLQQFDRKMIDAVIEAFDGSKASVDYFRYENDGWRFSESEKCDDDEYFDFHSADGFTDDMLAAARSIACLELVK